MKRTQWRGPHGVQPTDVTSWNVYHRSYLMELTPWKLPH